MLKSELKIEKIATPESAYIRVNDVQRLFGIKRGTLYNLMNAGKVKSTILSATGRGVRLVCVDSIKKLIN